MLLEFQMERQSGSREASAYRLLGYADRCEVVSTDSVATSRNTSDWEAYDALDQQADPDSGRTDTRLGRVDRRGRTTGSGLP